MLTIPVRVCGDSWFNPDEVHSFLSKAAGKEPVSSIWSEEYDDYEYVNRWMLMKNVIDIVMSMSLTDRLNMLAEAKEIALFNRSHLDIIRKRVDNDNKNI